MIETYDISSRTTSSDPGTVSARSTSEEMGSCCCCPFMTVSMSLSLVRTTLVTSTAKKKAQICVCMCIRPWIYYVRERESTSGGAEGPDPEDFQAGAFLTWHFVKTLTNKHSFTVFTFYRMRIPNACNANDNWCSWLQVISQLSGAKLKQV